MGGLPIPPEATYQDYISQTLYWMSAVDEAIALGNHVARRRNEAKLRKNIRSFARKLRISEDLYEWIVNRHILARPLLGPMEEPELF